MFYFLPNMKRRDCTSSKCDRFLLRNTFCFFSCSL